MLPPLRIATAGSVDNGKSTLIGRLLLDSGSLRDDQIEQLKDASRGTSRDIELAYVTDGLRAEREQGITIDVAYRYFSTLHRRIILADAPGHEEYTRNAAVAMSTAYAVLLLVSAPDEADGLAPQSRRHLIIARLLGVPKIVVVVNKMDAVGWRPAAFDSVMGHVRSFLNGACNVDGIPVSALDGDNVVHMSSHIPATPLLQQLTSPTFEPREPDERGGRVSIQRVAKQWRRYQGRVVAGTVRQDDLATIFPSGRETSITSILRPASDSGDGTWTTSASRGQTVSLSVNDQLDISRGSWITVGKAPRATNDFPADIVWFAPTSQRLLTLRHQTQLVSMRILDAAKYDLETGRFQGVCPKVFEPNDVTRTMIRTASPVLFERGRGMQEFLVIHPSTYDTIGAGRFVVP